jgi:non-specific serine/threonine protein kinase
VFDKTSGTLFNELNAAVLPSGRIELEWSSVENQVSRDQRLLQDELWKRIADDYGSFLLFLGFSDPSVPLSVSLDYWRKVTGRFAETLVRTPDLETLRHKATVALTMMPRRPRCSPSRRSCPDPSI